MAAVLVPIVIVGSGLLVLTAWIVRIALRPTRIESIQDMLRQQKAAAAAQAARALVARDPRNVDARFLLAQAYEMEARPELALTELKAIGRIGEFGGVATEPAVRRASGGLYQRFDQVEEALKEYLLLVQLEPQGADHYLRCGELFERRGNTDRALQYYLKATQLDASSAEAYYRLGRLLYRGKRTVEARTALEQAVRHDPDLAQAHFHLGKLQKDIGDFAAALASFERAGIDPELKRRALIERGATYMSMKNFERAIAELGRAIRLPGGDSDTEVLYARYFLAASYEKTRELDKAIEQWEQIRRLRPGFRDVEQKLRQYQDLRMDDRVKDYVTCSREAFASLCRAAVRSMGLSVTESAEVPNGCQVIATEAEGKGRSERSMPQLLLFLRVPEVVGESVVRGMMEQMRKARITRGSIFAASGFSRSAREFAESRPIDLHGRERLQEVLAGIGAEP